jgi:hypothetical protein
MPINTVEYNPGERAMAVDEIVQQLLEAFNPTHPDVEGKLEYGDGAWRLVVYNEPTENIRREIRFVDLTDDTSGEQKQIAHVRSTEILNAFTPLYNSQAVNLMFDEGGGEVVLTAR